MTPPMISLRSIMRSEKRLTARTLSIHFSARRMPTPPVPRWQLLQYSLYLESLPAMTLAWLASVPPAILCSWMLQISIRLLVRVSTTSASFRFREPMLREAARNLHGSVGCPRLTRLGGPLFAQTISANSTSEIKFSVLADLKPNRLEKG